MKQTFLILALVFAFWFISTKITYAASPYYSVMQTSLSESATDAQVGENVSFTVTLTNPSARKQFMQSVCFESTDGNFGCINNVNLWPGQYFSFSNSGQWASGGIKSAWVTWSPDGVNFYSPMNTASVSFFIEQ